MRSTRILGLCLLTLLLTASIAAAQTGKIAGRVTNTESNDPLPGVNVIIEGTTQGATTDADGYYTILNVRPGTYDLRATFIGYTPAVVQDVRVSIDLTTEANFRMQEEAVGLGEVVVTARPPIIQADISGTQRNIGAEEISAGRFHNVTNVVSAQTGVVAISAYEDRPGIRGSGFEEALFLVDGVSQGDPLTSRPFFKVNLDAVQEVKIETGGFSAEYGNLRSGVVNVVTKEGGDRYSGSLNVNYAPPGLKHFGPMMFGFDSPVVSPFVDPAQGAYTGYMMNADGTFQLDDAGQKIKNPFFDQGWKGWYDVAKNQGLAGAHYAGSDPSQEQLDRSAKELYARYLWRHRSPEAIAKLREMAASGELPLDVSRIAEGDDDAVFNYGNLPDYRASFTLGGPVPLLNRVKFFLSYDRERTEYSGWAVQDYYQDDGVRLRLTTNLAKSTKLNLHGFYGVQSGVDGGQGPDIAGFISSNPFNTLDAPNKQWYLHCAVPGEQARQIYGFQLVHTASANTFYQIDFSHSRTDYTMNQEHRNTAPIPGSEWGLRSLPQGLIGTDAEANARAELDRQGDTGHFGWQNWQDWAKIKIGDYWYDEAPWGYMPDQFRDETGEYRMSSCNVRINDTYSRSFALKGTMTSQWNRLNQLKAGFEVNRDHIFQFYDSIDPSVNGGGREISDATPWHGALFATNRFERKGLVANLGLRANFLRTGAFPVLFENDATDYTGGPFSDLLLGGFDEQFDDIPAEHVTHFVLEPRLGISHPISTVAKIYFNYGHMHQWPDARELYRVSRQRNASFRVTAFGNPTLKPARTIQYEVGYEHNLFNRMNLNLTGYYKDVNNEAAGAAIYPFSFGGADYDVEINAEFRDVRGFESRLELRRNVVPFVSGWASVNYLIESGGRFGYDRFYEDNTQQPRLVSTEVSNPDVRPIIKTSLDFHTPDEFGPGAAGFFPVGGINLNLLYTWQRGAHFTWNPESYPLVEDNLRWKSYQRWDMRLQKTLFEAGGITSVFYMDVTNLFNHRNLLPFFTPEGQRFTNWTWNGHKWWKDEQIKYMESLNIKIQENGEPTAADPSKKMYKPGEWNSDDIELPGFTPLHFRERRQIFFGLRVLF